MVFVALFVMRFVILFVLVFVIDTVCVGLSVTLDTHAGYGYSTLGFSRT